jgi:hypothetical protein
MTKIRGIVVQHEGHEYLITADDGHLPDLLERGADGTWHTLKRSGPGGRAGATANEILHGLGIKEPVDHTQQDIKKLFSHAIGELVKHFFHNARW